MKRLSFLLALFLPSLAYSQTFFSESGTAVFESSVPLHTFEGSSEYGIIANGVSFHHSREAAPDASFFKPGMTHPLPVEAIRHFTRNRQHSHVIEEGDPVMWEILQSRGVEVSGKPESFRFGELNVQRVKDIISEKEEAPLPRGKSKPPQLCTSCPHRSVFAELKARNLIVSGDIGCYTLGVLPPFEAMDTCVCMGAALGVGLGLRHALPAEEGKRVVSVIGDSTFMHSGLTGLAEMVYNPPESGHVVLILDNSTTAMTGLQEHPGTGRSLDHLE